MEKKNKPDQFKVSLAMTRTLIVSMLILKTSVLYFGLKYSEYPGEGYGYGLAASVCLTVFNISYFLYKMKDIDWD